MQIVDRRGAYAAYGKGTSQSLITGADRAAPVTWLGQFDTHRYILLETFKRNGEPIGAPMWFAEENGKLFVWTIASSGKVKRIRGNPKARICPSSSRGKPKGTLIEAQGRILDSSESERPRELIKEKYGLQYRLVNLIHGRNRVIIELSPI